MLEISAVWLLDLPKDTEVLNILEDEMHTSPLLYF